MTIDTNYYLKQGETPDQYKQRHSALFALKDTPSTPTTTTQAPTIGSIYGSVSDTDKYIDSSLASYKGIADTQINEQTIRDDTMRALQAEIDATNRVFADKLREVQQQGIARIGSGRAISARRGTLGSDFGNAQEQNIQGANNEVENAVRAEQALAVASINNKGLAMAKEEIAAKTAARQQGAEAYLKFLGESEARRSNRTANAAQQYLAAGIDPTTLSPQQLEEVAKSFGIDGGQLKVQFKQIKDAQMAAEAEAEREQLKFQTDIEGKMLSNQKTAFDVENQGRVLNADLANKEAERLLKLAQSSTEEAQRSKYLAEVAKIKAEANPTANSESSKASIELVKSAIKNAKKFANASGNTGIVGRTGRFLGGADDYTNLTAQANTIRTNLLTLYTDPAVKKFFGPQMSNADVQLMTSAGTTLNPELQTPETLKEELIRAEDLISRLENTLAGPNDNDPLGLGL